MTDYDQIRMTKYVRMTKISILNLRRDEQKKIPISAASMSRWTIAAYLRLYLKNRRKEELMQQRVNRIKIEQIVLIKTIDKGLVLR